jgi:hypothetical protein
VDGDVGAVTYGLVVNAMGAMAIGRTPVGVNPKNHGE